MRKQGIVNIVVVMGVIGGVAGIAWYKSAQVPPPAVDSAGADASQPAAPAAPPDASTAEGDADMLDLLSAATQPTVSEAQQPGLPRVVDLGADKCIPCKKLAPIIEELKKEYAGRVTVEFIDVWKNPKAGKPYNIRIIPTQIFFDRDGKEVWRHEGFMPKADFVAKFAELGVE